MPVGPSPAPLQPTASRPPVMPRMTHYSARRGALQRPSQRSALLHHRVYPSAVGSEIRLYQRRSFSHQVHTSDPRSLLNLAPEIIIPRRRPPTFFLLLLVRLWELFRTSLNPETSTKIHHCRAPRSQLSAFNILPRVSWGHAEDGKAAEKTPICNQTFTKLTAAGVAETPGPVISRRRFLATAR